MARKMLKPCPFCGVALKPFISTHEVTTADGNITILVPVFFHRWFLFGLTPAQAIFFSMVPAIGFLQRKRKSKSERALRIIRVRPITALNFADFLSVLDVSLEGFVTNKGWLYVKRAPDIYPIWMPIPKPPKPYLEDEQ